ncbi:pyridoxamine 5'-phosphate oxidase family protein [Streptosporangium lutulentum]|uniref:Nitroimidazol reductase NimA-like FMN-containing flavoprotein (Pyridoxamine 5'-phosphate oxidase superfamily) n=1 Tax=Streptosporangium lutulentum TaxID=1461250 RepID=A0ABT9QA78_9ACTN|nr:pyridoxamine 5'-phosphate oxidase family protein [Streptosporangium lutulentum]MDP9843657.1 nitroimidazol reductase NimA-like FMN-containing flavoprotein (pyridoxamine 5'-phosphate oxidase superfamily) [Streptosporangium lutulentum]
MNERELRRLSREESLRLLSDVAMGRVVFTMHALPAIQPVNHVIDGGDIIIRTHLGAAITMAVDGHDAVVAYEADAIDPDDHLGWSVIIVGMARLIHDEGDITRYRRLLRPWVSGTTDHLIRIRPELVTGSRLVIFSRAVGPKDP